MLCLTVTLIDRFWALPINASQPYISYEERLVLTWFMCISVERMFASVCVL